MNGIVDDGLANEKFTSIKMELGLRLADLECINIAVVIRCLLYYEFFSVKEVFEEVLGRKSSGTYVIAISIDDAYVAAIVALRIACEYWKVVIKW